MAISEIARTCRVVPGEESTYGHCFGGPPIHRNAAFRGAKQPLHLLYCFNLSDPALSEIKRPGGTCWLALYYGFPFDECRSGYRIETDERLTLFSGKQKFVEDWPYAGYPPAFPRTPVRIEPLDYETQKALVVANVLSHDGDDRLEQMSEPDRQRMRALGYPFTQIGGHHRLIQGPSASTCPNPSCEWHRWYGSMHVFATIWNQPVPGVSLWGPQGECVELVYEQCDRCAAIRASNQCD